ncbi:MAG: hypothetical protein WC876_09080 [Candidatus Thermoplasmatota archaeon]|jgi:hypothetical protein
MNPFATIDWPNLLAFIAAEIAIVLLLAPVFIQRKNEERAVAVFTEKLLPLMPKVPTGAELAAAVQMNLAMPDVAGAVREALGGLQPSPEQQAAAQAQLVAGIGQAVQAAIGDAVKGRMGALSAQGVDGRASKALNENALKARVGEKYGLKGLGALAILKTVDKSVYELGLDAVSFAPGSLDEWLDQNAERFSMGGVAASKKITVV